MTGMTRVLSVAAALAAAVSVSGCETIGSPLDALSAKRDAPDEFQVLARKPLRMPGSLSLPEPRLGEISPLEPDPGTDAVVALLGSPVSPVQTGTSSGEQSLLGAANANATQTEIRALLDQDIEQGDANEPYETPTIFELFSSDEGPPADAINPQSEARRLQTQGVSAAPIDPADRPAEEGEAADSSGPDLFYQTDDGKPANRLPSAPTETAF